MRHMAAPSKRAPSSKTKPARQPPAAVPVMPAKPFLRFYHSEALRKKTL